MGFERNDGRYGYTGDRYRGERGYGAYGDSDRGRPYGPDRWDEDRGRSYGGSEREDRARSYGDYGAYGGARDYRGDRFNDRPGDYGRGAGDYRYRDRGFFDRAGDEVRSWFGDEEAELRRRMDERFDRSANRGYDNPGHGYRSRHDHDPNYRTWRDRQLESLDRDYDEYRRENQSRFDNEFGSWRQTREGQRALLNRITEHQEVIGSDGAHIGTVDQVRGDRILLTRSDSDAGGHHHSIPSSWISAVEDKVTLSKTADQAKQHWRDEQRNEEGGLFGRSDDEGRTNLNRSFSGTY